MKTLKAVTALGTIDLPIIKIVELNGFKWVLAENPYYYMNSKELSYIKRIFEYSTGRVLPIKEPNWKSPNKRYFENLQTFLDNISESDLKKELNKFEIIN